MENISESWISFVPPDNNVTFKTLTKSDVFSRGFLFTQTRFIHFFVIFQWKFLLKKYNFLNNKWYLICPKKTINKTNCQKTVTHFSTGWTLINISVLKYELRIFFWN